jgi:hypothetical protein
MNDDLIVAMAELDEDKALDLVKEKIGASQTALAIIEQCRKGVERAAGGHECAPDRGRRVLFIPGPSIPSLDQIANSPR